jgi:biopolymer transport protein ExbD
MKKCSKSVHHSLTELNITPLLDLAFVLLVIFIITTIPPVTDLDLTLPLAAKRLKDPPRKANYISVQADGKMFLNKEELAPEAMVARLTDLRSANNEEDKDLSIIIRGDGKAKYKQIRAALDVCQQANVLKVDLATEMSNQK